MKENKNYIYWLVVIAGCGMIGTCLGLGVNVAGLFFSPIAKDFNVGRGSVSATLMVYNLIQAFNGLAAPASLRRFGLKKMVIFGTVIQAVTTFLLSVSPNVVVLMILNGIRGFASGLIGTVAVTVMINYWFNKNNGLMTSIAMGFSGLAAALLSPILSGIIANAGWRTGYMVLALITVLFNLPAILFPIALKPDYKYMEPYGGRKEASSEGTGSQSDLSISVVMLVILMVYTGCSAAAAAMYGLCYSMGTVSTAMLTREMFGPAKYSRVYPKPAMATTISNAVFTTVVGMLYDMSGTYSTVILFLGCLIVLAFCMVQLAYARKAKMVS